MALFSLTRWTAERNTNTVHHPILVVRLLVLFSLVGGTREYLYEPDGLRAYPNTLLARAGDVSIGFIADLHYENAANGLCKSGPGSVPYWNCAFIMASNLAIDQINNRTDILPNITLGLVTVDGCQSAIVSLEQATNFIKDIGQGQCQIDAAAACNGTGATPTADATWLETYHVVGVMGLISSVPAVAVAPMMGIYEIPVIGLDCTSDQLSDMTNYPYFSRVVSPDSVQILALLELARMYSWSYINLVYSQGAFGENGASQTLNAIRNLRLGTPSFTICLAVSVEVPGGSTIVDIEGVVANLMSDDRVRVILSVLNTGDRASVYPLLMKKAGIGRYLVLGTDAFVYVPSNPIVGPPLIGSIYIDHYYTPITAYEDYIHDPEHWFQPQHQFLQTVWQTNYGCDVMPPDENMALNSSQCAFNSSLVDAVCTTFGWSVVDRLYDSAFVLADSLHRLIANRCPEAFLGNKSNLVNCVEGNLLLKYVRNTSIVGASGLIEFTSVGNRLEILVLKQIQMVNGTLSSVVIGTSSPTAGLSMIDGAIDWSIFSINGSSANSITPINSSTAKPLESVCSRPCLGLEYMIGQSSSCCWVCSTCLSNEVITANRTACQTCPPYTWPDADTDTVCEPITPIYLQLSDPVTIAFICLAVIGATGSLAVIAVYTTSRSHPLIKATTRELCYIILLGTLVVSVVVIIFSMKPDRDALCGARSIGFHLGINLIYTPLLIKNIRIYRVFAAAQKSAKRPAMTSNQWQIIFTTLLFTLQVVIVVIMEFHAPSRSALDMPSEFVAYVELYCNTPIISFLVPLSYNILIILVCSVIGFMTRRLPENFNESWFIFLSAATTLFAWAVFVPAYFTLGSVYLQSAVLGCCLLINGYINLGCLFGPVLYAVAFVPPERIKIVIGTNSSLIQVKEGTTITTASTSHTGSTMASE